MLYLLIFIKREVRNHCEKRTLKKNEFFIESKFFKGVSQNLNPDEAKKPVEILKERANSILTWKKSEVH